ncbi:MAG: hypothetical protein D6731_03520 [Planctomycetota bacterium]|nr:MAG: hypothetical protein D6731_03520 [Planctomycetota bacterium]
MTPSARILCLALFLTGCAGPPPAAPGPPSGVAHWMADRGTVRALRDFLYAGYALRLARERPEEFAGEEGSLAERLGRAREGLREALRAAGANPTALGDDAALLREAHAGIRRGGRYALCFGADADSFSVLRVAARDLPREVRLFGTAHRYRLTVFDEVLALDYPAYRAERLGLPPTRQAATYARNGEVRVDRAAAREVGERLFLPHLAELERSARLARDDRAFLALAERPLAELLMLTKAALRWRSLEPLWGTVSARPRAEQLARFVDDYAQRAELRAVAEQREAARICPDPEAPLDAEARARLFLLGSLSAMIHGEPLGALADVVALAAVGLRSGAQAPHLRAAKRLVAELAAAVRRGEGSPRADALAFARLARAEPEALRALARALYRAHAEE